MKVKELISLLRFLDQEKEIKIVTASGYEYEEETESDFKIVNYTETQKTRADGRKYYSIDDFSENKDFYLIQQ